MEDGPQASHHSTIKRRAHKKSHNGCSTCKLRHLKCDETLPTCLRCQKSGRDCGNVESISKTRNFRGFKFVNLNPLPCQQLYLDYFCKQSLPILSTFEPSPLWPAISKAIQRPQSPVRFIAIAVGCEHSALGHDASDDAQDAYLRAVCVLRKSMDAAVDEDISEILIGSLLLAVLQSLRGSLAEAVVHLHGGIQIARGHLGSERPVELTECLRLLEQLAFEIIVSDARSEAGQHAMKLVYDLWATSQQDDEQEDISTTQQKITRGLLATIHDCFDHQGFDRAPLSLHSSRVQTVTSMKESQTSLESVLRRRLQSAADHISAARHGFMLARCLLLKIFLNCAWHHTQTIYDTEILTHKEAYSLIETALSLLYGHALLDEKTQVAFAFGFGPIASLVVIALGCRDTETRHKAVALLDKCPPSEGVWTAESARRVTTARIGYEERRAVLVDGRAHIPEEARIHHHVVQQAQSGETPARLIVYCKASDVAAHFTSEAIAF